MLDEGLTDSKKVVALLKKKAPAGEPYDTEVLSQNGDGSIRVKVIERKSGLATTHALGHELFDSREYRQLTRVHQELQNLAGTPPFKLKLSDEKSDALSFEELRAKVLALAKRGVRLQRFKGLGEMNPLQLRETTMARETRRLVQLVLDGEDGAEKMIDMLLAKARSGDRREWLMEKGNRAEVE